MKKKTAQRREGERQKRKTQIIRAARKVFLKKGYQGATIRDIARESSLSTGSLYFYFKGKDEIYGQICENIMELTHQELLKGVNVEGTFLEKLSALAKAYVGFYVKFREDFDLLESAYKQVILPQEVNQRIEQLVYQSLALLNKVFVEAVQSRIISQNTDTWELTLALWSDIEGAIYLHKRDFLGGLKINLFEFVENKTRIFERGIR
ncbi:TetR/AcrR family transcriptional regulator [bacterium]|nr:TetR/AcrR family transcriptional regulator [bacterium]